MSDANLKIGDIVQLKSGGPNMTYEGESQLKFAICTWFDDTNTKKTDTFRPDAVKKMGEN